MESEVTASVLGRIRKLQRLTRSSNEHEAALAAAKMQELLFAHNLSIQALQDPSEFVESRREVGARIWAQRLYVTLCQNNFCQALHGHGGLMYAVGRRENVAAVNEMFLYLVREIERIAKTAYQRHRRAEAWPDPAREWGRAFRNGAVAAIGERLREQRERDIEKLAAAPAMSGPGALAIIRRLDQELQDEVARRYPYATPYRRRTSWIRSSSGFAAGQEAGSRMALKAPAGHLKG